MRIKAILFDLDGVLCESKRLHKKAFIDALSQHGVTVTSEQHDYELEGRPTKAKLDLLGIAPDKQIEISRLKQELTYQRLAGELSFNPAVPEVVGRLGQHFKLALCSNSVRKTCILSLQTIGIDKEVKVIVSNEDVSTPKPSPEMYLKAMDILGVTAKETIIIEDSEVGLTAAYKSKAHVFPVTSSYGLEYKNIMRFAEVCSLC